MRRALLLVTIVLLLAGVTVRLSALEADPDYYSWIGSYIDEGRWSAISRHAAIADEVRINPRNHNWVIAPAFEAASFISFKLAGGISLFAARIFPALCGSAILIALLLFLRGRASPVATFAAVSMVALQEDLVSLARVGIPETASMLGALLTWLAVDFAVGRRKMLALSSLLLGATLAFKLTGLLLIPTFGWIVWRQRVELSHQERARDVLAFSSGIVIPGLLALIGLAIVLPSPDALLARFGLLAQFLALHGPFDAISRAFDTNVAPGLNVGSLGLWLGALAMLSSSPAADGQVRSATERRLESAMVWAGALTFVMLVQSYYPERYQVRVYIPLALVVAFAVTRLESAGWNEISAGFDRCRGLRRLAVLSMIALPLSFWLGTLVAQVFAGIGLPVERLAVKLLAVAVAGAGLVAGLHRGVGRPAVLVTAIAAPIFASVLWLAAWVWSDVGLLFWQPSYDSVAFALRALGPILLSSAIFWAARHGVDNDAGHRGLLRAGVVLVSLIWSAAWLGFVAPDFLSPHFSQRQAGEEIGRHLQGEVEIHQFHADGLFLANELVYDLAHARRFVEERPKMIVTRIPFDGDDDELERLYDLVEHYVLPTPERFEWPVPYSSQEICGEKPGFCVGVFRLKADG